MHYRVFLDTNIYDASNYSFNNELFRQLRSYAVANDLTLVINSVIEGEVRSHIKRDVKEAAKELNKVITGRRFAGFRNLNGFSQLLEKREPAIWVETCLCGFDQLLSDCYVDRITVDGISVEKIMEDYFAQNPPFDIKKPDEFKDAIAVASLLNDINIKVAQAEEDSSDDLLYCVVSADKGFSKAVRNGLLEQEENVCFFDSLKGFIDHTTMMNRQAAFLKAFLLSESGRDGLEETVRQAIDNAELNIYLESGDYVDDQDLIDVYDIECEPYILGIFTEDGKPSIAKVALDVKCKVKVWYKYTDEFNSYWDKEDQAYLWKTEAEMEGTYEIEFETVFSVDISDCRVPANWKPEGYGFEVEAVEFCDYLDMPQGLELSGDNLVEEEVLAKSEPFSDEDGREVAFTTCPDCGVPIGIKNDSGNGYCVNCAGRH